jgi:broad specificity phosphatase PhoE
LVDARNKPVSAVIRGHRCRCGVSCDGDIHPQGQGATMTQFLLIRHGNHDGPENILFGRTDEVGLSSDGREQIRRLGLFLARPEIDLIYTSPRRRCRETASELALVCDAPVEEDLALDEVDYGAWTGHSFRELSRDAVWTAWNDHRDFVRVPGGERMRDVQIRVLRLMQCVSAIHPGARVVLVTHAEVIRAAMLAERGMSLRQWSEIDVEPGSVWPLERSLPPIEAVAL